MHATRSLGASRQRTAPPQFCRVPFRNQHLLDIELAPARRGPVIPPAEREGAIRAASRASIARAIPTQHRRAARQHDLSHLRPLPRAQNPAGGEQRISRAILEITLRAQPQGGAGRAARDSASAIRPSASASTPDVKTCSDARPVDEGRARTRHDRRPNGDRVPIARIIVVQDRRPARARRKNRATAGSSRAPCADHRPTPGIVSATLSSKLSNPSSTAASAASPQKAFVPLYILRALTRVLFEKRLPVLDGQK